MHTKSVGFRNSIEKRFREKLKILAPTLSLKTDFYSMTEPTKFYCSKCKSAFVRKPNLIFTKTHPCIVCGKKEATAKTAEVKKTRSLAILLKELANRDIMLQEGTFTSGSALAKFKCLTCGHSWSQYPKALVGCKHGCRKCANVKSGQQMFLETYINTVKPCVARVSSIIKAPKSANDSITLRCKTCSFVKTYTYKSVSRMCNIGCGLCQVCGKRKALGAAKYGFRLRYKGAAPVRLYGYEDFAWDWIITNTKISENDILTGTDIPAIPYKFGEKNHVYFPDMYIPSINAIVEVKSTATAGLGKGKGIYGVSAAEHFTILKAKARATVSLGYKFILVVMSNEVRVKIPKNWLSLSRKQVLEAIYK